MADKVIHKEVGETALKEVLAGLSHLKTFLIEKDEVFAKIKTAIEKQSSHHGSEFFNIQPYGSTSVLLCEAESDVDICVQILPAAIQSHPNSGEFSALPHEAQSRHFLETIVGPAMDPVLGELLACLDKPVPVIKGAITMSSSKTRVDITCNEVGRAKTRYLLGLYSADTANFAAFVVLVQWARHAGLIKHLDSDDHVFETAVMYAFIVHLLFHDKRGVGEGEDVDKLLGLNLSQLATHMTQQVKDMEVCETSLVHVGHLVHDFFRFGHSLAADDMDLSWPVDGVPLVHVLAKDVVKFRKACSQSLHALLTTRDIRQTIDNAADCCSTQTTYCKKLSLSLSSAMGLARDFHERELSFKTNAKVTITEEEGEDRLVLRAEGSRRALSDLRVELTELANSTRVFTIGMEDHTISQNICCFF